MAEVKGVSFSERTNANLAMFGKTVATITNAETRINSSIDLLASNSALTDVVKVNAELALNQAALQGTMSVFNAQKEALQTASRN